MITVRKSSERGGADLGWLQTRHSFSFDTYFDPNHMGFGDLRVINEDDVAPGKGFGTHPHRDMEIISYIVKGAIAHRDSLGNETIIRRGEIQVMSAGTGVTHSEFNPSASEPMRLLQIWIKPKEKGIAPRYAQRMVDEASVRNRLGLLVGEGDGALPINQEARVYAARLDSGKEIPWTLSPGRRGWIQVVDGRVKVNDVELSPGDGAALTGETTMKIKALEACEILAFDLK